MALRFVHEVGVRRPREAGESPFSALSARHGQPLRVAILSDFTRISYANGAAFQTRSLYQELRKCGHQVTVVGPHDPDARPSDLAPGTIELPSIPMKSMPGLHIPMPLERWVGDASRWDFDFVFAQTTSMLLELGVWLRKMRGIPLLSVNTTHLVATYDTLLPEKWSKRPWVHAGLSFVLKRPYEKLFAGIYNEGDGLVVLSSGLRRYWRERGVTVPIHVIPRAVTPASFDRPLGPDPFLELEGERAGRGARLLCAGRLTREKSQDRLVRIFARHVAPVDREATLTIVGNGPDREMYKRIAREEGVADRVFFPGEVAFSRMADFYAHADMLVHTSLSETYGNVLGEALWCGTPTVAFADGMGTSAQIQDGVNGILVSPGNNFGDANADAVFGHAVLDLLADPHARASLGQAAARIARERSSPRAVQQLTADAFRHAQEHAAASGLRAAADGPRVLEWLATWRHFRPWAFFNGSIYVAGHIRPPYAEGDPNRLHPQIGV
jgi:glycosyltransferase involved in cell wall biosynthesis